MAVGYIFGCLTSIILWGFDREKIFYKFNEFVYKKVKSRFFYTSLICNIHRNLSIYFLFNEV